MTDHYSHVTFLRLTSSTKKGLTPSTYLQLQADRNSTKHINTTLLLNSRSIRTSRSSSSRLSWRWRRNSKCPRVEEIPTRGGFVVVQFMVSTSSTQRNAFSTFNTSNTAEYWSLAVAVTNFTHSFAQCC